ncbi:MAG: hypothetical protein H8E44_39560 [Planctomycetes bacterium]|nr:hypothetical protein [Planctomycetota bacterium]
MCCNEKQKSCQRPEILTTGPANCTPEQIRNCHGEQEQHPCVETTGCEHPERLKGQPGECSPDQVRECHGDTSAHPCDRQ